LHNPLIKEPSKQPTQTASLFLLDGGENEQSTTMISKNHYPGEKSSTVTSTQGHLDKTSTLLVDKKREQLLKSNTDMLTIDSRFNMEHPRSANK